MSQPTILGRTRAVSGDRVRAAVPRWPAAVILVLVGLSGAVLLGRRLAGALEQPLPAPTLAALGVLLAGTALSVRWLWCRERPMGRLDRVIFWTPTLALLPIVLAVHLQGTSLTGIALFWSALLLGEGAAALWVLDRQRRGRPADGPTKPCPPRTVAAECPSGDTPVVDAPPNDETAHQEVPVAEEDCDEVMPGDGVTQQFVRSRTGAGEDVFAGWLRVDLPPGGRTTHAHLAFCPPFARAPAVEVYQVSGPEGRIKTAQSLPHGARLDFKLSRSTEQGATVLLRVVASASDG